MWTLGKPATKTCHTNQTHVSAQKKFSLSSMLVFLACFCADAIARAPGSQPGASRTGMLGAQTEVTSLGAANFQLEIQVPPGIVGTQPKLALQYNSQQGEGLLGLGVSLTGLSTITRCGASKALDGYTGAVSFNAQDRFCLDGARLILVRGSYGGANSEYRTETETFARIVAQGACGSGPCAFVLTDQDGASLDFASTTDSRPIVPGAAEVIAWQIARTKDLNGNAVRVQYRSDASALQNLPERIFYSENAPAGLTQGTREVRFEYEPRPDALPRYMGGLRFALRERILAIRTTVDNTPVLRYQFSYRTGRDTARSLLSEISVCSARTQECLDPTKFVWQESTRAVRSPNSNANGDIASGWCVGAKAQGIDADFNGDGKPDLLCTESSTAYVLVSTGTVAKSPNRQAQGKLNLPNLWCDGANAAIQWSDFNGDRKIDALCTLATSGSNSSIFKAMISTGTDVKSANNRADGSLSTPTNWCSKTSNCQAHVMNFDGDGRADLSCDCANGDHAVLLSDGSEVHSPNRSADGIVASNYCTAKDSVSQWSDFNGDGQSDLFCHEQGKQSVLISTGQALISPNRDARGFLRDHWCDGVDDTLGSTDFNGDGLTDLTCRSKASSTASTIQVLLSTGRELTSPNSNADGVVRAQWCQGKGDSLDWGDFNSDGLSDAFCHASDGKQMVMVSNGTALVSGTSDADGLLLSKWCANGTARAGSADFNGDALDDLRCWDHISGTQAAFVHSGEMPDLLASVSNGIGGATNFRYQPITDSAVYDDGMPVAFPRADVRSPIYVVERFVQSDGRGADYAYQFRYQGARTDLNLRRWLGFEQVKRTALSDGRYTVTGYLQDYPVVGFMTESKSFSARGLLLSRQQFTPKVINTFPKVFAVMAAVERNSTYTLGVADFIDEQRYEYDAYGNKKLSLDLGDITDPQDEVFDCWVYQNNTLSWRLGLMLSHRTTRTEQACRDYLTNPTLAWNPATDLRWDQSHYDSANNPTALDAWDDQHQSWLVQRKEYDLFGNIVAMTDWASNRTELTMDASHNFVAMVRSPSLANNLQLNTTLQYDESFGNVVSQNDANDNQSRAEFDAFGRLTDEYGPAPEAKSGAGNVLLVTHRYGRDAFGAYVDMRERGEWNNDDPDTWPHSRLYMDGMARPFQTIRSAPQGGPAEVITEQEYDSAGRIGRSAYPRFVGTPAAYLLRAYDDLDRLVLLTQPDGTQQHFEYLKGELLVRTTLAKGSTAERKTWTYQSVRGVILKTEGANQSTVVYTYDPLLQKLNSTGPRGDLTTFEYDSIGRVVRSVSADSGSKNFVYDAKGRLQRVEAGAQNVVHFDYDALDRIKSQRIEKLGVPEQVFEFDYDDPNVQNGLGQLTRTRARRVLATGEQDTEQNLSEQSFAYTRAGEALSETLTIDGQIYTQRYAYTPTGERSQLIYPDGAILDTRFDAVGNPTQYQLRESLADTPRTIAEFQRYSAQNQALDFRYGNGTRTRIDHYSYAENMARTKSMQVSHGANQVNRYNAQYGWNAVGQLVESTQQYGDRTPENSQFAYDTMGWLQKAQAPYGILDFTYDVAGNIKRKDGVSYRYEPNSNRLQGADNGLVAQHDTLGNVTQLQWPGEDWHYQYDGSGNLTTAALNGVQASQYVYDFAGHRLKRTDSNGDVSIYVSADFDVAIHDGNAVQTRYVHAPFGRIAASSVARNAQALDAVRTQSQYLQDLAQRPSTFSLLFGPVFGPLIGTGSQAIIAIPSAVQIAPFLPLIVLLTLCFFISLKVYRTTPIDTDMGIGKRVSHLLTPWVLLAFLCSSWPELAHAKLSPGDGLPTIGDLYFHSDTTGSSVMVSDALGEESSALAYFPFGGIDQTRSTGPNNFRAKFAGSEQDPVGLNYMGARYQHPTLGRFLQPDPENQFTSPYSYVGNDPLSLTDPNGEEVITAIIFVTVIVIGAIAGAYSGGSAVNHSLNPGQWDWRSGETYAGVFAGAVIGAAGAAVGGAAAEVGVAAGIAGEVAVGVVEGAAFSALGGGSPSEIAESALTGGIFGGVAAGAGSAISGLASRGSRMLARGEASLAEQAASEGGAVGRSGRQAGTGGEELASVENRTLQSAESASENARVLSPSELSDTATPELNAVCYSFVAGTQIATSYGPRDVAHIQSGDLVWATQADTHADTLAASGTYPVLALFQRDSPETIKITLSQGDSADESARTSVIITTPEHPFWVDGKGWVTALTLRAGEMLRTLNQGNARVESVRKAGAARVFNFEVADAHTYFAGDDRTQVLVHNVCNKRRSYMGSTPSKRSGVGKTVIQRMRNKGYIRTFGKVQQVSVVTVLGGKRVWKNIDRQIHMGHIVDAVGWWNKTGYKYGARAKQVRAFMRDASNYELEWGPLNSSNGAKLKAQYRPPKK
jgi:RHS repeat-associated protein